MHHSGADCRDCAGGCHNAVPLLLSHLLVEAALEGLKLLLAAVLLNLGAGAQGGVEQVSSVVSW